VLEVLAQVILSCGCEFTVSGIRKPCASRDIRSRSVAPDRPRRQIGRSRCTRHYVDEDGGLILPKRFCLRGGDDACASKRRRSGCTIIVCAKMCGFGHSVLAANTTKERRQSQDQPRDPTQASAKSCHFAGESPMMGWSLSSSSGTPNSISSRSM